MEAATKDFVWSLPKAELHLHLEGTLEPEMMMTLAERNRVDIGYPDVDSIRQAYVFTNLQSFLDLYYAGCSVLITERDFYDLTAAYLQRAESQGVRHAEVFFDPQTHTQRGIRFETVIAGIHQALVDYHSAHGITSCLILAFLRHLSEEEAIETLRQAEPFREWICAIGLDSAERGNPPAKFARVYEEARRQGYVAVAHAGEEGPPSYIWQALDVLRVQRIDHGVRCLEDEELVKRLVADGIALTVCPLSNVKLRVFPSLAESNLPSLLERGLRVTINSDDPAYFGGYLADNLWAVTTTFKLTRKQVMALAANSFYASFLPESDKKRHLANIEGTAF